MPRIGHAFLLCCLTLLASVSVRAEEIFGLTSNGKLVRFDSANPGTLISTVTITGLQASETLVGIDFRPESGELLGVGSTSRAYKINVATGAATAVGADSVVDISVVATPTHFNMVALQEQPDLQKLPVG